MYGKVLVCVIKGEGFWRDMTSEEWAQKRAQERAQERYWAQKRAQEQAEAQERKRITWERESLFTRQEIAEWEARKAYEVRWRTRAEEIGQTLVFLIGLIGLVGGLYALFFHVERGWLVGSLLLYFLFASSLEGDTGESVMMGVFMTGFIIVFPVLIPFLIVAKIRAVWEAGKAPNWGTVAEILAVCAVFLSPFIIFGVLYVLDGLYPR